MAAQPGPPRSALKRYLPLIVVVAVAAIVIVIVVAVGGDDKKTTSTSSSSGAGVAKGPVLTFDVAKADGTANSTNWGPNCDTTTGRVKIPAHDAPPCVPAFSGDNGGDIDPAHGVTKDTIRIARYVAPPDPAGDFLAQSIGLYDSPDQLKATNAGFLGEFSKRVELYGRKIELVDLTGTGNSSDEQAAQSDAEKAKELKVFAVLGGPSQTKSFAQTLANEGILCVGSCLIAQPGDFYKSSAPYLWPASSRIRPRR